MISNLSYALRQMRKNPGFTGVAVLILALGIASNTAVFTVIDTLLVRGLSVKDPDSLVLVSQSTRHGHADLFSYTAYRRFQAQSHTLAGVAAVDAASRIFVASGFGQKDSLSVVVHGVSGGFFSLLGVVPAQGRMLTPEDDQPNAARPVTVLSYAFWQRQFGGDPDVVGKTVLIDKVQFTIVGVGPQTFRGVLIGSDPDLWIPLEMYPVINPAFRAGFLDTGPWLHVMGRMRSGMKLATVSADLDLILKEYYRDNGIAKLAKNFGFTSVEVQPGGCGYISSRPQSVTLLTILMTVVGLVLLIACANVASLLFARSAARQREFALRAALGAGRGRLVCQLLAEGLILSLSAGVLGVLLTGWGTQILTKFVPGGQMLDLAPDRRIACFALTISIACGFLVALIPALRCSRLDLISTLKEPASTLPGGSSQRLIQSLVAGQIALSVCLLAGAGLFARTLENLRNIDLGFNREGILICLQRFGQNDTQVQRSAISRNLQERLAAIPGVRSATFTWAGASLMAGGGLPAGYFFSVKGYVPKPGEPQVLTFAAYVGPAFFETLEIPILQGRGIQLADVFPPRTLTPAGTQAPAASIPIVINDTFARRFFAKGEAIGGEIHIPTDEAAAIFHSKPGIYKIVGVVKDTKQYELRDEHTLQAYFPSTSLPGGPQVIRFVIRTSGDPTAIMAAVRAIAHSAEPGSPDPVLSTMDASIDQSLSQERVIAQAAAAFSVFALLLASLGLYGILAYNVTLRTREIGVRMALGAGSGNIIGLVLRQGLLLAGIGCVAGTAAAAALTRLIASLLFGLSGFDPATYLFTSAVLLVVALLACWLPARRATKVDPIIALRAE